MAKFFKVLTFVPRKIWTYTKIINTAIEAPLAIQGK